MEGRLQCIEELGTEIVTAEHLNAVCEILHEQLNNHEERRLARDSQWDRLMGIGERAWVRLQNRDNRMMNMMRRRKRR